MTELTRLARPTQASIGASSTPKECHAEGLKYPSFRQVNKESRVLLSPQYLSTDQNYVYRYFVVSNKKGWFAAIQNNAGTFGAVLSPLSELRKAMKEATGGPAAFPFQRTLSFSTSEPNILAFSCNDSRLVVGFKSGQVIAYDTSTIFTPGSNDIPPLNIFQSSQHPILDIIPNPNDEDPSLSNLLAVVRTDGTVQLLNSSLEPQGGWVAEDADSTPVAASWSPKGKQLAIGLRQGDILTFTLESRTSPQRHIPPTAQGTLVSLQWLAPGHTFRTTYAGSETVHHIVCSANRTTPAVWTRLEYPFQLPDRNRLQSYAAVIPRWDDQADDRLVILVGDMSCTDLEIIGNIGNEWYQQSQENPLSIPLDKDSEETVLLSLQVDFTDSDPSEGGHPIVYAYLNDGTLQGWYVDHPEKKSYTGIVGNVANVPTSTPAFAQPSQPAFGTQPSSFGQSSTFGNAQASSSFVQIPASSGFGQPSFGQASFGQPVSSSTSNVGSSNTSGGFASFASNSASPFGTGSLAQSISPSSSSFGGDIEVEAPPIARDASMSDSTPAFGGLSLGDSDESNKSKSTFGGASSMFGTPSPLPLPPDHPANKPAQTSAFASGAGSSIKPATGFGAFGGSSGGFGAFGNTGNTNSAFTGGAFSSQPATAFASNNEQPKSGAVFGQSSFGQPSFGQSSFGKPSFGQPAFGQSSFGTKAADTNPSSGGFGAFAQTPTSFISTAASTPKASEGGFSAFAGTPTSFGSAPSSGKTVFGGSPAPAAEEKKADAFADFASKGPSPFGQSGNSTVSSSSSGGAFGNFVSNGPSVFGQPASTSGGGAFGGTQTASPSPFGQTGSGGAFGAFKSETPSVFGQQSASPENASGKSSEAVSLMESPDKERPATPIKSEPPSPTSPSSPQSDTASPQIGSSPVKPFETSSSTPKSSSILKPAAGFGAFGNTLSGSSPFLKTKTENDKPLVSAFGSLGSTQPTIPSHTQSSSPGPTFGATSQLGFGFGLKPAVSTPSSSAVNTPTTSTGAFSAFSGTASPFAAVTSSTKSFGDLLKEGKSTTTEVTPQPPGKLTTPPASPSPSAAINDSVTERDETPANKDTEQVKAVEELPKEESISSMSSSFVEVTEVDENEEDGHDEIPGSEHGDDDDVDGFLSGSQSEEEHSEEGEYEEVGERDYSEEASPSPSPEPTEIPLPPSRSRSSTPLAETPRSDSSSPSPSPLSSEDTESSRLSTIREESTTPPGSPTKPQTGTSSTIVSPAPVSAPLMTLGIGRPSTRPTRSSPLANKPLTGIDENEEQEDKPRSTPALKPRPASPKTPFGVMPSKSRSTSPEDSKLSEGKRPKTPPLLSNFFGTTSTPSTPKPAAASLPSPATPVQSSSDQDTPAPGPSGPSSSSTTSLFGKPFSLQPAASAVNSALPKIGSVFSPPPPGFFSNTNSKTDPRGGFQTSSPVPTVSQPMTPSTGMPRPPSSFPSPFSSPQLSGPSTPGAITPPIQPPSVAPALPPMEDGMQKECVLLVELMHSELERLRARAGVVAKKREMLSKSAGGSHRKEDLGSPDKWAPCDAVQFGAVMRQFEQDISELKTSTEKQNEDIRGIRKSMIKAGTRREEIARFNKAKSDNEFLKMLKSRTLGPEHLENQTQLRRNIRTMRTKVEQLEDQLRAHKKRLSEVNSGRPTLRPPSLDTIHRTYRNIDIALQQQGDEVAQLNARLHKLDLNVPTRNSLTARDPRLPSFSPHSRPSIITPDVAVTTAAALNAERSAHKLRTMLLKARQEPLLNTKAREAVEGGKKVPLAFATPKSSTVPPLSSGGISFNTPIMRGPLFGDVGSTPAETGRWDTLSFPEDNFHPSTPLSSGGRRGLPIQRKHGTAPSVKKSPAPASPEMGGPSKASAPVAAFDWGPLPTFNKPSTGLPGFENVVSKSPASSSPAPQSGGNRFGMSPSPSSNSFFSLTGK